MEQNPTLKELMKRGNAAIKHLRASIDESRRLGIQTKVERDPGTLDAKRLPIRPDWRVFP